MTLDGPWAAVEDLGSRSGTCVNGDPVHQMCRLVDGDIIAVGRATLTYRSAQTVGEPAGPRRSPGAGSDDTDSATFFPPGPDSAQADQEPERSATAGSSAREQPQRLVGTAHGVRQRVESRRRLPSEQVLTFRMERHTAAGERRPPVSVEMRGLTITGGLTEGEQVEAVGHLRGGTLFAREVRSISTGGRISSSASSALVLRLGRRGAVLALVGLVIAAGLILRFIPQLYYNTPFGRQEYRANVLATCARVSSVKKEPLPASVETFNAQPNNVTATSSASILVVDRDQLLTVLRQREERIQENYQLLLQRYAPVALSSRQQQVRRLVDAQRDAFQTGLQQLQGLPAQINGDQLSREGLVLDDPVDRVETQLSAALTALAGTACGT